MKFKSQLEMGTKALFLSALFLLFFANRAQAKSRVYIQNNTHYSFTVSTHAQGNFPRDYQFKQTRKKIDPAKGQEVFWFNRDNGIGKNEVYTFQANLYLEGYQTIISGSPSLNLLQKIKGSWNGSELWYGFSVQSSLTPIPFSGWQQGDENRGQIIYLGPIAIKIDYRQDGDDIYYVLSLPYSKPAFKYQKAQTLSVLAYNVQLFPSSSIFNDAQWTRVELLPEYLNGYDVLILSEIFGDKLRKQLIHNLRFMYPYYTKAIGEDFLFEQDGGVMIFSRYPIIKSEEIVFDRKNCASTDCMAAKGVMYAQVLKEGKTYHVFGTHLQASYSGVEGTREIRKKQLQEFKRFIDFQAIPSDEPVLMGGDFNIDMISKTDEFNDMLEILKANFSTKVYGHPATYDPTTNSMTAGEKALFLDYVLTSNNHQRPKENFVQVRLFRHHIPWVVAVRKRWDLSDHYPIMGIFHF